MKNKLLIFLTFTFALALGIGLGVFSAQLIDKPDLSLEEESSQTINVTDPIKEEVKEEDKFSNVHLRSVGDIMYHMPQVRAGYKNGVYDYSEMFKYVKPYIEGADIAVGNYETVAAGNHLGFSGFPNFNSPVETIEALSDAGFNIMTTVNNHSLDQGKTGIINTIKTMEENNIVPLGTRAEPGQFYYINTTNDIKIGYLAYSYGFNGNEPRLTPDELNTMVSKIDREKIKKDIRALKEEEVDIIISFIHWGVEYDRDRSDNQKDLGVFLLDEGVDLVLGSHPHVIQTVEKYNIDNKDKYIVYSMGNFFSNQRRESLGNLYTEDGVIVSVDIEKNLTRNETYIKKLDFHPTWVHRFWNVDRNNYYILPIDDVLEGKIDLELNSETIEKITNSRENTVKILNYPPI